MIDPSLIMPVCNPQPLKAHFVVIRIRFPPISNLFGAANLNVRDLKLNKYVQQMRLMCYNRARCSLDRLGMLKMVESSAGSRRWVAPFGSSGVTGRKINVIIVLIKVEYVCVQQMGVVTSVILATSIGMFPRSKRYYPIFRLLRRRRAVFA